MSFHQNRQVAVVLLAFAEMLAAGVSCAQDATLNSPKENQRQVEIGPREQINAERAAELRSRVQFEDALGGLPQDAKKSSSLHIPVSVAIPPSMDPRQVRDFAPPSKPGVTSKPSATSHQGTILEFSMPLEKTLPVEIDVTSKKSSARQHGNQLAVPAATSHRVPIPNRYANRSFTPPPATQAMQARNGHIANPQIQRVAQLPNVAYQQQVPTHVDKSGSNQPETISLPPPIPTVPSDYDLHQPLIWWDQIVAKPMRSQTNSVRVDVTGLMTSAAQNSARIQAVRQAPWITGTQVVQAQSGYDPTLYADTMFDSTSDPVGNSLTTGGPPRLEEDIFGMNGGLRGENRRGATYDVGQRMGHTNSNSTFFTPNDQGTARMAATWTEPLMRNRGMNATRSLILTAQFDTKSAEAEYQDTIQQQLAEVANTYWSLYQERATYLQRVKHLERAQEIAQQLERRRSLDAVESQILRANAAVANRRAELAQSDANIRNAESRIRAHLTVAGITDRPDLEMLPVQTAALTSMKFDIEREVAQAIKLRPEIQDLNGQIGAARIRLELAKNQTKPLLNLVMEGYVAGLRGESDVFGAWSNQFGEGRPGYAGGLEFEMPYRNRAANARLHQRRYELTQLEFVMKEQIAVIRNEVESAIRTLEANRLAVKSRQESLAAVNAELAYQEDRWQRLAGDARLGQLQLDDLLNAHVRLLQEEQTLLGGLIEFNLALIEVQRATGSLVRFATGSR